MDSLLDNLARSVSRRGVVKGLIVGLIAALAPVAPVHASCPAGQKACGPLGQQVCCPGVCCSGNACCDGCCAGTTSGSCRNSTSHSLCGHDGQRCVGCSNIGNVCDVNGECACCPSGLPDCTIHCFSGQSCIAGICV